MIFILAALIEGKNPPNIPMTQANINEPIIISGVIAKEKLSSEKEAKLRVDIVKN